MGGPDLTTPPFGGGTLPQGVRSRIIHGGNGLDVHILEAGYERPERPLVVLLHGFPDLAYGWRRLLPIMADAGFRVVAPDLRGYGRTAKGPTDYNAPLAPFSLLNLTRDVVGLVSALGYRRTALLVGHDLGSPIASYCALTRPDIFPSLVLMSAPFPGPPAFPFNVADAGWQTAVSADQGQSLSDALARLDPPRKHYQQYLTTRQADGDLSSPPEGLHAFLRAFYHVKSADWRGNAPYPLRGRTACDLAEMPTYYVMDLGKTMPEVVRPFLPAREDVLRCNWLTEAELDVYAREFGRTGFQGALQLYRVLSDPALNAELRLFSGKAIEVPTLFIGGRSDWGPYAAPGAIDLMQSMATTRLAGIEFIEGAGHWIQQEQPLRLARLLLDFIR
jgi:pimeloyl-ACP methyl ester carboxylesterase